MWPLLDHNFVLLMFLPNHNLVSIIFLLNRLNTFVDMRSYSYFTCTFIILDSCFICIPFKSYFTSIDIKSNSCFTCIPIKLDSYFILHVQILHSTHLTSNFRKFWNPFSTHACRKLMLCFNEKVREVSGICPSEWKLGILN